MRELKFRAWDGEKMHYDITPWRHDFVIDLSWHRCERSTGSGVLGCGGKEADFLVGGIAFKEIMQFTGLLDKNGREIYEGDVVEIQNLPCYLQQARLIEVVVFSSWGAFGVELKNVIVWKGYNVDPPEVGRISFFINVYSVKGIRIIGNVHANPELVK